jgi:prepilin-type N-terminal cleavage/methylation domain-containing protein
MKNSNRRGFTLLELVIVMAVLAIITAIAIGGLMSAVRRSQEKSASATLKQMASAQAVFRSGDSDQNGINDFYTNDIAGLYWIAPAGGLQVRLIEPAVAMADGDTRAAGQWTAPSHSSSAKGGYWFQAMPSFESTLGVATAYGPRHTDKFGVIAYPNSYGSAGDWVFILSEDGTQWKKNPGSTAAYASTIPANGVADTNGVLTTAAPAYGVFPIDPVSTILSPLTAGPWSKTE